MKYHTNTISVAIENVISCTKTYIQARDNAMIAARGAASNARASQENAAAGHEAVVKERDFASDKRVEAKDVLGRMVRNEYCIRCNTVVFDVILIMILML
jgi:hypothetical protein